MKNKIWEKMKKSMVTISLSGINMLALLVVVSNVNVTCGWYMHQPELPESLNKYIKD